MTTPTHSQLMKSRDATVEACLQSEKALAEKYRCALAALRVRPCRTPGADSLAIIRALTEHPLMASEMLDLIFDIHGDAFFDDDGGISPAQFDAPQPFALDREDPDFP